MIPVEVADLADDLAIWAGRKVRNDEDVAQAFWLLERVASRAKANGAVA